MASNYTPIDLKTWRGKQKKGTTMLNAVLAGIGLITAVVLSVLLYMLYTKSSGI